MCTIVRKVKNAQNAGAVAVLIGDTVAENAVQPIPLGGVDPTITITASRLFLSDAALLKNSLARRSRTSSRHRRT